MYIAGAERMGSLLRRARCRVNRMQSLINHAAIVIVLVALLLSGCGPESPDYPERQMPDGLLDDPAQVEAGQVLFRDKCSSCHGKPSEGRSVRAAFFEPPAPDFTDPRYQKVDPAYLFWRIQVGKTVEPFSSQGSVMPSWQTLSVQEIWQLVAYLKSRSV
jgi:mono/diheme cytochrome c family protein